jgi:urease accessory protein
MVAARSELPLLVQRPLRGPDGEAIVTLLTPSGALFGGDEIALEVQCHPGTRVTVRQVAATKLHRCENAPITVDAHVRVAAGASFQYLPFELIPFAETDYRQSISLHLEQGAQAVLSEVLTPGRLGEHFRYRQVSLRTEVYLEERLIVLDAQRIMPGRQDPQLLLAGSTHVATLLLLAPDLSQHDAERLSGSITHPGVQGAASLLPAYGIGARLVGRTAESLLQAVAILRSLAVPSVEPEELHCAGDSHDHQ